MNYKHKAPTLLMKSHQYIEDIVNSLIETHLACRLTEVPLFSL